MFTALLLALQLIGGLYSSSVRYPIDVKDIDSIGNLSDPQTPFFISNIVFVAPQEDSIVLVVTGTRKYDYKGKFGLSAEMNTGLNSVLPFWKTSFQQIFLTLENANSYYPNGYVHMSVTTTVGMQRFAIPPTNATQPIYVQAVNQYANASTYWALSPYYSPDISNSHFVLFAKRLNGAPGDGVCSVPSVAYCFQCAWPYQSYPDTNRCGCKIVSNLYQSKNQLAGQCNAYCNSTAIHGNQSYIDYSRSNFDVNHGSLVCRCSDPISHITVTRPTGTCPAGTSADTAVSAPDSLQHVAYDPSVNDSGSGSGSGSGLDSSSKAHLSRIDSILGTLADTAAWRKIDSANGKGTDTAGQAAAYGDTGNIRGKITGTGGLGDTSNLLGLTNTGARCGDLTALDTTVTYTIPFIGERTDTLKVSTWLAVVQGPFRALGVLLVVLAMAGPCLWLASGSGNKEGS